MADVIAERYSRALFDLAEEKELTQRTEEDARFVLRLMEEHPELYRFLQLPDVALERKQAAMERILADTVAQPTAGLVRLLIRKARIPYLRAVMEGYLNLLMESRGQIRAQITSAAELSAEEQKKVIGALESSLGKEILPKMQVDPGLIGGLIVRVGDRVYDNSIRSSMERLSRHLSDLRIVEKEKGGAAQA